MFRRAVLSVFALFVLLGCGRTVAPKIDESSAPSATERGAAISGPPIVDVLFIGNSYTFSHELPEVLEQIATATEGGPVFRTEMVAHPDYSLEQHWRLGEAAAAIARGGWEFVVLQGHSLSTLEAKERLYRYARLYAPLIRAAGAQPVFFMTWARRGRPEMMETIGPAYAAIAAELDAVLVPAGRAWITSRASRPDIHLHHADGSHPSPAGSYLAAAMFYDLLGDGTSCVGSDHGGFGYLDTEEIRFLQETALRHTRKVR
jgi:hypothetical protein